jgi:hypothetical protein
MSASTKGPGDNSARENKTVIDVLRHYSEANPKKGQILAEYLDYLEDCFCYQVDLRPG